MTLKMLEADPGAYAAGIAGAPVTKWELYDTAYTERYLGDPRKEPTTYARPTRSPMPARSRIRLLVIHGMSDDNVVFENSTALFGKLQAEDVPFEMMVYPGYTHRVSRADDQRPRVAHDPQLPRSQRRARRALSALATLTSWGRRHHFAPTTQLRN